MVTKFYLRTENQASMRAALLSALASYEGDGGNPQPLLVTPSYQVVLLPELRRPCIDDEEPQPPLPGYHANVITDDPAIVDALAPITIEPKTPLVGWAGWQGRDAVSP